MGTLATAKRAARRRPRREPPAQGLVGDVAGMLRLVAAVARALVRPDFSWRREFVSQSAQIVRRCLFPLSLSAIAFIFGVVVVLVAGELRALGAIDRTGRGVALGATREFATWLTGMIVAGVAGTAICADLGARKIREELDAMAVLATDPIRSLVLPRFIALAVMTPVLYAFTAIVGILTGAIGSALLQGVPFAAYMDNARTLVSVDIIAALIKMVLVGLLIATVFCFKGLGASGGSAGVGRAVNQAVVVVFVAIFVLNYLYNATFLGFFPSAQVAR